MNASVTFAEAVQQYLGMLENKGKSKRTLYTYGKDLEQILSFFGPNQPVQNVTLPWVGRFLKSNELLRLSSGGERSPQTVNKTIRVFRMLLVWLHKEGKLTEVRLPKSVPMGRN